MFFRVGGFSAFWLLWLLRGFCGFRGFSLRIICIHSSSLFASSALPVPLRQVAFGFLAFWLFGFLAFWLFGFLAFWLFGFLAFWLFGFWRLSGFGFSLPDAFPVGFLHPQHRKFLSGPPATPLSIKMHAYLNHHFFDHHATATF